MDEFLKIPELSGKEKAAVLVTEIGSEGANKVFACLRPSEVDKILKAVSSLGKVHISDEIKVLSELNAFGVRRGITRPVRSDEEIRAEIEAQKELRGVPKELRKFINQNPDTIADALSAWMGEE